MASPEALSGGGLEVTISADASRFHAAMQSIAARTQAAARKVEAAGRRMTMGLTVPLAAAGAAAVKSAAEMENALAQSQSQAGLTDEALQEISESAEEIAVSTGQSFEKVVAAYKFAQSAGLDLAESQEIVETSAKAAAAGFGDQTTLLRGMTTVMAGYGDEAGSANEIMDKMVSTAQRMEVEVPALTEVMGQLVQVSSETGVSFDEMLAAVGSVGEQFGDVSRAGNLMSTALTQLLDPSQKVRGLMEDVGTSAEEVQANIEKKGLTRAMSMLRARTEAAGIEFARMVGSARSARVMLALTSDEGSRVAEIMESAKDSTGALNEAFQDSQSFSRLLSRTWQALRTSIRPLGDVLINAISPALATLMTKVQGLSRQLEALDQETLAWWLSVLTVTAAVGPLTWAIGKLGVVAGGIISTLFALSAPLVGAGGLVAAFGVALAESKTFRNQFASLAQETVDLSKAAWEEYGPALISAFDSAIEIVQGFSVATLEIINGLLKMLRGNWRAGWAHIERGTSTSVSSVMEELEKLDTKTKAVLGTLALGAGIISGGWVPSLVAAGTASASFISILNEGGDAVGRFGEPLNMATEDVRAFQNALNAMLSMGMVPDMAKMTLEDVLGGQEEREDWLSGLSSFGDRAKQMWKDIKRAFMGGEEAEEEGLSMPTPAPPEDVETSGIADLLPSTIEPLQNVEKRLENIRSSAQALSDVDIKSLTLDIFGLSEGMERAERRAGKIREEMKRLAEEKQTAKTRQQMSRLREELEMAEFRASAFGQALTKGMEVGTRALTKGFKQLLRFGGASAKAQLQVLQLEQRLQNLQEKDSTPIVQKRIEVVRQRLEEARQATKPLASAFKSMGNAVVSALSKVIAKLTVAVTLAAILTAVTGGGNFALGGTDFTGFGDIFGTLIGLQEGGIVQKGPMPAVLHGSEAVIPLDRMKEMGGAQNVHVTGEIRQKGTEMRATLQETDTLRRRSGKA